MLHNRRGHHGEKPRQPKPESSPQSLQPEEKTGRAWQQGACVPQDPAEQTNKQKPKTEQNTKNDLKKPKKQNLEVCE